MKKTYMLLIAFLSFSSCEKNFVNPNNPNEEQIYNSLDGMQGVILGIKNIYTVGTIGSPGVNTSALYGLISMSTLLTSEFRLLSHSYLALAQINSGGTGLTPENQILTSTWASCHQVNAECVKLLANAKKITDAATQNAVIIYARVYRAIALGTLAILWESAPVYTGEKAAFVNRNVLLSTAVSQLDSAYLLTQTPIPPAFKLNVLGNYEDMANISLALSARYNLFLTNYKAAMDKAKQVNLSSKSVWVFDAPNPNPVFQSGLNGGGTMGLPYASFGLPDSLQTASNDQRIPFYQTANSAGGFSFYSSGTAQVPYYVPGEMWLIIAESYLRLNDANSAVDYINKVRTKTATQDVFGIGAGLPPYSGALDAVSLAREIYKQRCCELYSLGLKLEDSRRLNRTAAGLAGAERKRNFLPYPIQERNANPNTPANPAL